VHFQFATIARARIQRANGKAPTQAPPRFGVELGGERARLDILWARRRFRQWLMKQALQ
jgi:hypothetical protein